MVVELINEAISNAYANGFTVTEIVLGKNQMQSLLDYARQFYDCHTQKIIRYRGINVSQIDDDNVIFHLSFKAKRSCG